MLNDSLVFNKIKEGDIKAFESVFRRYYASLCLYAFSITKRKDVAEEIVQELFFILWKERGNLRIRHSLKSYLYGAVKNQSLQHQEREYVRERYRESVLSETSAPVEPSPQEQMEYKELEDVIERTLKKLPERRLQIFRMHRMDGKKYKEIAESFSISVKTVEAEMTKAYRILRQAVEKYKQDYDDSKRRQDNGQGLGASV
jgi:RNA polymerase sigma-70 factor (ECF subfamily)